MTGIAPVLCPSKGLILPLNYTTLKPAAVIDCGHKCANRFSRLVLVNISIQCICFDFNLTAIYSSSSSGTRTHHRPLVRTSLLSGEHHCPARSSGLCYSLRSVCCDVIATIQRRSLARCLSSGYVLFVGLVAAMPFLSDASLLACIVIDCGEGRTRSACSSEAIQGITAER